MEGNAGPPRCLLSHCLEPKRILHYNQGTLRQSAGRLNSQAFSHRTKFTTRSGQYNSNLKEGRKKSKVYPAYLNLPCPAFTATLIKNPTSQRYLGGDTSSDPADEDFLTVNVRFRFCPI